MLKRIVLLCLIYGIITANKKKFSDAEASINSMFKEMQERFYKNAEEIVNKGSTGPNREFVEYKKHMYDYIMKMGQFKEQYEAHQNLFDTGNGKAAKCLFRSFLALNLKTFNIPQTDDPYYFMGDRSYVININKLPQTGKCKVNPWSSTYWAMRYGGISVRYPFTSMNTMGVVGSNGGFSSNYNWYQSVNKYSQPREYNQYKSSTSFPSYVDAWYSPAEKYDLAHADENFTLTNYCKQEGAQYLKNGDIPSWYGICHGWVLASYLYPTPTKPVTVTGGLGGIIRFLPDDVKALASQFYANVKYTTRWIGARCDYNPGQPGWSTSLACRSLNAASFLIAIANWMGIRSKCAVLDPKADAEIWNQPWKQYQLRYYNIITNYFYSDPEDAKVSIDQVRSCRSPRCRNALASNQNGSYFVGCFFQITYAEETNAVHTLYTLPDKYKTDNFDSTISLDENDNIIGGNWNTGIYPNFVWMPAEGEKIGGINDDILTSFKGTSQELKNNRDLAISSSRKGQVLKAFIDWLVVQSSTSQPS
jgi:hypothetical protein